MLSLIKSVLKSIELYLSLKNKLFYIELRYSHEKTRKKVGTKSYYADQNGGDADRADLLRDKLIREDSSFQHLSTFYSEFKEGDASKHK